jgi:thiamine-phosphate pyrophosphorylase
LITDRRLLAVDARTIADEVRVLERWLDEAVDVVDAIQIREPDLPARVLEGLAARLVDRARRSRTLVLVNDRADAAASTGADGVHLRADGPSPDRVRAISPVAWVVGRSIHRLDEARANQSADYLTFGAVFATPSKPARPAAGLESLAEVARQSVVPVVAIGGINAGHAADCRRAGASGVAAIRVFLPPGRAPDAAGIGPATAALREAMAGAAPIG